MENLGKKLEWSTYIVKLEQFLNPNGSFLFTMSINVRILFHVHFAWVDKQVKIWQQTLNIYSGAKVRFYRPVASGQNSMKFEFHMHLPGEIVTEGMHKDVAEFIQNNFRKMFALHILSNFPPPFELNKPICCKKIDDVYHITPDLDNQKRFVELLQAEDLITIVKDAARMYNASLMSFRQLDGPPRLMITIQWKKDVDDHESFRFSREIECDFSAHYEISCDCIRI